MAGITRIPTVNGISRERVSELQRFCWQYREKLTRLATMQNAPTLTAEFAATTRKDARDIDMIEHAAFKAAKENEVMAQWLIHQVCDRAPAKDIPMGQRQFYAMRRRFFVLLDEMR